MSGGSGYGPVGEAGAWAQVSELYHWDRLEEAAFLAAQIGAGEKGHGLNWIRNIEPEAMTRKHGQVIRINDWLELEFVSEEVPDPLSTGRTIAEACEAVCQDFLWAPGPPVRAAILAQAATIRGRSGFCVDKNPYDKICFAAELVRSENQLTAVARHEFAHVMTINRAQNSCPPWLDEAVAMAADEGLRAAAPVKFWTGRWPWLSPRELDAAFRQDFADPDLQGSIDRAYQQAAVIGRWIGSRHGKAGIARLLDRLGESPFWPVLWCRLRGEAWIDRCLRIELGTDEQRLFDSVLGSL